MIRNTISTEGPKCPYCGMQYTADDPRYYNTIEYTDDTCDGCLKPFKVSVEIDATWVCFPIKSEKVRQQK